MLVFFPQIHTTKGQLTERLWDTVSYFLNIFMSRVNQIFCIKYTFIFNLTQAINCHAWFKDQLFVERAWYTLRSVKVKKKTQTIHLNVHVNKMY